MRGAVCRLVLLSLLIVVGATRNTAAQATWDRACLTGVADAWFAVESINLRRVQIADEEKGLVFGLSMFHHSMNEKVLTLVYPDGTRGTRDMTTQRQFDMAAAHIIKVRDRKIHEIEAIGAVLPFNSKSGWSDFLR